jgi:hypothetical protein
MENGIKLCGQRRKNFVLDVPDGFSFYWHDLPKEEDVSSTPAQGDERIMIWIYFTWDRKGSMCFVDGRLNSNECREVL